MTGLPAGMKAEVNFGGTWTDVTAYTAGSAVQIHYGRTSVYSDAAVATLQGLRLNNDDGRFTPKCQLLADGVTANPYYPYVVPRAEVRLSYTISGTTYYRFYGYVQGWPPLIENLTKPYTMISAVDRGGLLNGVTLSRWGGAVQSMLTDSPMALVPFNDPAGTATWSELITNKPVVPLAGATGTFTTGADAPTPFADGQNGLTIAGVTTGITGWQSSSFTSPTGLLTAWTLEGWLTLDKDTATSNCALAELFAFAGTEPVAEIQVAQALSGGPLVLFGFYEDATNSLNLTTTIAPDNNPHHYAMTGVDNGTNIVIDLYYDGVLAATASGVTGAGVLGVGPIVVLGAVNSNFLSPSPGVVYGPCAFSAATFSPATLQLHVGGGTGGTGYTTGQRITEYLRWYGVATGDQNIATGLETVGQHPVAGQTILKICQDMASTEGGGAVFYHDPNGGKSTFLDRHFRSTTTPLFTVDAEADLDGSNYAPSFDALTITNQSNLTRQGGATVSYTNDTSVTQYGLATDSDNSQVYCGTDAAALRLAQDRVSSQSTPAFRVGRLTVDLLTAMTSGLYQLVGVMFVGSRLRVTNLLAALHAPVNQVDVYAEGWTESISAEAYSIAIDTDPADNPPRGVASTMKVWPVLGNMTLNTTITAAGTTILIANSDGYYMTTNAASYPIDIVFGEEQITLTGVPGGTTSPQTFTGCTRGVNNTRAAPQTAGAVLSLAPKYGKVQL